MTKILNAFFMLIIITALLLLDSCCSYKEKEVVKRDTVLVDTYRDTFNLQKSPELIYDWDKPDIVTKPFSFQIDTVIITKSKTRLKHDTLKINYQYPQNMFNFSNNAEILEELSLQNHMKLMLSFTKLNN